MAMYQSRLSLQGITWAVLPVQGKSGGGPNSLPSQQDRACLFGICTLLDVSSVGLRLASWSCSFL